LFLLHFQGSRKNGHKHGSHSVRLACAKRRLPKNTAGMTTFLPVPRIRQKEKRALFPTGKPH
jgi:hypothetical protein